MKTTQILSGLLGVVLLAAQASGGGPPPNDACVNKLPIFDGTTPYYTDEATTDGVPDAAYQDSVCVAGRL